MRAVVVERVDFVLLDELDDADRLGGFEGDFCEVLLVHDDVLLLCVLVALQDLVARYASVAARTAFVVLDPAVAQLVNLVEGERLGARRWVHPDGDVHERKLEESFPRWSHRGLLPFLVLTRLFASLAPLAPRSGRKAGPLGPGSRLMHSAAARAGYR